MAGCYGLTAGPGQPGLCTHSEQRLPEHDLWGASGIGSGPDVCPPTPLHTHSVSSCPRNCFSSKTSSVSLGKPTHILGSKQLGASQVHGAHLSVLRYQSINVLWLEASRCVGQLLVTVSSDGDVQMARWSLLKRSLAPTIFPEEMAGALVHVLHPTAGSGRKPNSGFYTRMGFSLSPWTVLSVSSSNTTQMRLFVMFGLQPRGRVHNFPP